MISYSKGFDANRTLYDVLLRGAFGVYRPEMDADEIASFSKLVSYLRDYSADQIVLVTAFNPHKGVAKIITDDVIADLKSDPDGDNRIRAFEAGVGAY